MLARRVGESGRTQRLRRRAARPRRPTSRRWAGGSWPSSASTSTAGSRSPRPSSTCSTASAGASTWRCATSWARAHARARELERELGELRERAGTRDRDLDLLAFEIDEIEALEPSEEEKEALLGERERLRRMDAPAGGRGRRGGGDRAGGRRRRRGRAARRRRAAGRVAWRASTRSSTRWRGGSPRCASRPRTWAASCAATPRRSRPSPAGSRRWRSASRLYDRLERKHGGSVAAVLAHAERCRAERERLEQAEVATERAAGRARAGAGGARRAGRPAGAARAEAAPALAERVREELACARDGGRRLRGARWSRARRWAAAGAERVELMLAPNPGVPAAPIREAASGGELSRVMLALMTVAGRGRVAHAGVRRGRRRRGRPDRARGGGAAARCSRPTRQVLCITHLPQIAALAGQPLPDREVGRRRLRAHRASRRSTATAWWRSSCGCWAPRPPTARRASTPAQLMAAA